MTKQLNESKILVFLPYGLGDSLQCIPALNYLSEKRGSHIVVVVSHFLKSMWQKILPANFIVFSSPEFQLLNKENIFREIYDLSGREVFFEIQKNTQDVKNISHKLFIDPLIKKGFSSVYVNDKAIKGSYFFDVIGKERWPAAAFYRAMILVGEVNDQIQRSEDFSRLFCKDAIGYKPLNFSIEQKKLGTRNYFHKRLMRNPKNFRVAFCASGSSSMKRWPVKNVVALMRRIRNKGIKVDLFLGPNEIYLADQYRMLGESPHFLRLNKFLMRLKSYHLCIANDCGPMHLSAVLGIPTLAIFGSTEPDCWFPYTFDGHVVIRKPQIDDLKSVWPKVSEVWDKFLYTIKVNYA